MAFDWTDSEQHQLAALIRRLGKACNGKRSDVVVSALGTVLADITVQLAPDEVEAHAGADAFCRDVKRLLSERFAAKKAAH